MSRASVQLLRTALATIHYTGIDRLVAPLTRGAGVIFMLHQVNPEPVKPFEPNRILKVTPAFLDTAIEEVRNAGFDIISITDVARRLSDPSPQKPYAVFTADDGYRDNRDYALPVFRRHGVPFTVYVPSDFADGAGDLWWLVLQEAIRALDEVPLALFGLNGVAAAGSDAEKTAAFDRIYWHLRAINERDARRQVAALADHADYDAADLCRQLILNWDELRAFANDPLVTIGAHTKAHFAIAGLTEDDAIHEMVAGRDKLEQELGFPCRHFSFPYGSEIAAGPRDFALAKSLGFETAVTTRKGMLQQAHADTLTALPRLSLNGDYQDHRFVRVLMSGAPFALLDAARRLSGSKADGAISESAADSRL